LGSFSASRRSLHFLLCGSPHPFTKPSPLHLYSLWLLCFSFLWNCNWLSCLLFCL
jgi:hypothetical protein